MTYTVGFDTSLNACSVALWREDVLLEDRFEACLQGHAVILPQMIQDLFHQHKVSQQNLSLVLTTVGPGSFTGLRIGLSFAQGLLFSSNTTEVGFTTFDLLRVMTDLTTPTLVCLDTKRGDWYTQQYGKDFELVGKPQVRTTEEVQHVCQTHSLPCVTDQSDFILPNVATHTFSPRARFLKDLRQHGVPTHPLTPLYMREPSATVPTK